MNKKFTRDAILTFGCLLTVKQCQVMLLRADGLSLLEIAAQLRIDIRSVSRRLAAAARRIAGVRTPRRSGKLTEYEQKIFDLRALGFLYREIAEMLGTSVTAVGSTLYTIRGKMRESDL